MENVSLVAVTHEYDKIKSFDLAAGRYFSLLESNAGKNVCIIGMAVSQGLFGEMNPVGEQKTLPKPMFERCFKQTHHCTIQQRSPLKDITNEIKI